MKFSGVMIGSSDSDKLAEFYTRVLGAPAFQQDTWYGWFEGGFVIGTHSEVHGKSGEPQRMMLMLEVDDVAGEFDRIAGLGANVISKPYQPGTDGGDGWLATLEDPDGNYLQLHTPMSM